MTLRLTPENLHRAYEFLCTTEPFDGWNLPDASDIRFRVVRDWTLRGWYTNNNGKHCIAISTNVIGHTINLIATMAHEMIHLHENCVGMCKYNVQHSAAFKKLAIRVCKVHGFDAKLF